MSTKTNTEAHKRARAKWLEKNKELNKELNNQYTKQYYQKNIEERRIYGREYYYKKKLQKLQMENLGNSAENIEDPTI